MLTIIVFSVLAEIGFSTVLTWVLGTILSFMAVVAGIWNFISYIKSKASKEYVDNKLTGKVDQKEFDEHKERYEMFVKRYEYHNGEIQRIFFKEVKEINEKIESVKNQVASNNEATLNQIIEILKK